MRLSKVGNRLDIFRIQIYLPIDRIWPGTFHSYQAPCTKYKDTNTSHTSHQSNNTQMHNYYSFHHHYKTDSSLHRVCSMLLIIIGKDGIHMRILSILTISCTSCIHHHNCSIRLLKNCTRIHSCISYIVLSYRINCRLEHKVRISLLLCCSHLHRTPASTHYKKHIRRFVMQLMVLYRIQSLNKRSSTKGISYRQFKREYRQADTDRIDILICRLSNQAYNQSTYNFSKGRIQGDTGSIRK